jgi:hypothetical protein
VGWLKQIRLRRKMVSDYKMQSLILEAKKRSVRVQLMQIDSFSPEPFSFPYRIKFRELLDIEEEYDRVSNRLRTHGLLFILTGRLWKK